MSGLFSFDLQVNSERLPGWARYAPAVGRAGACLPLVRQAVYLSTH